MGWINGLFEKVSVGDSVTHGDERKKPELSKAFADFASNNLVKILGGEVFSSNAVGWIKDQDILEGIAAGKRKGFSSDDFSAVIRRGMAVETIGKIGNARSQSFLENLATTDPIPEIRKFATGEVKSQMALADIIRNEQNPDVLKAAIKNVKRPYVLKEAMLNNYENASILVAISDRIKELPDFVQSMIGKPTTRHMVPT